MQPQGSQDVVDFLRDVFSWYDPASLLLSFSLAVGACDLECSSRLVRVLNVQLLFDLFPVVLDLLPFIVLGGPQVFDLFG